MKAGIRMLGGIDNSPRALHTYMHNLGGPETKWIGEKPTEGKGKKKREITPEGCNTGNFEYPLNTVICDDITKWSGKKLLKAMKCEGELGLLVGGPPCQGFSFSNPKRCITDPRSQLMWEFIRMVGETKPKFLMIENVPGLMSYKDFVHVLMKDLEGKGYVVRVNMINASSYGVPQNRIRVFFQGAREDTKKMPEYPVPQNFDPKLLKINKEEGEIVPKCKVVIRAFAKHGYAKQELKYLWWNKKLNIYMNKKTAADVVMNAYRQALIEGITGAKISEMQWYRLKLPEIKQAQLNEYL